MPQATRTESVNIKYYDQCLKKVFYDIFCTLKINHLLKERYSTLYLTIEIW